jgi:hypothetical protein
LQKLHFRASAKSWCCQTRRSSKPQYFTMFLVLRYLAHQSLKIGSFVKILWRLCNLKHKLENESRKGFLKSKHVIIFLHFQILGIQSFYSFRV